MIETIKYNGKEYLLHQAQGNGTQFAGAYAKHYCKGIGYDIGCAKKEWALEGAIPIDLTFHDGFHAMNLPLLEEVDYIYSSHCLEHIPEWVKVLEYWYVNLKTGGVLFLYLPHYDQEYWRPWNNKKHVNIFTSEIIKDWMESKGFNKIFWSERDLNHSFMIVGEK